MSGEKRNCLVASFFLLLFLMLIPLARPATALAASGDWPTYLHDPERTGADLDETTLSAANASGMVKLWSFPTGGAIASSATVVGGVAYFGSWDGYEYAVNAVTGALIWKTFTGTTSMPNCSPSAAGITSSATVQGGVVYVGGGDSYWYALDASTGAVLWRVYTGDNSPTSGHYNWSSPLIYQGYAYIGVASFGDCPLVQGQLLKVDLQSGQIVATFDVVPTGQVGGGIWTSPSLDPATGTIFVTTGTIADPSQQYSQAVVALDAGTLAVKAYWQLPASEAVTDSDWGTTPALVTDAAGDQLLVAANKNGYLYAFNRNDLAAGPTWQDQIAIGGDCPTCGDGTVSSVAFANNEIYAAGGNTTIGGVAAAGSVRAIDSASGTFKWEHADTAAVIAAVTYANGLVFAGAGPTFEVLDAASGARLYGYTTGSTIYGPPSISDGVVYAGSVDGSLYAWGLPASPNCPSGWTCQDIGSPVTGGQTFSAGTWSIQGAGADIWETSDQFHFVWESLAGDGAVSARVTSQTDTDPYAKAGVMLRQSPDPASAYYAMELTPGNGILIQYRSSAGVDAVQIAAISGTVPAYLEVARSANTFTAYTSSDGTTWTPVSGSTVTLNVSGGMLAGLAVTSHDTGVLSTATFADVSVTDCPPGWSCVDVGSPAIGGGQTFSGGTGTVDGAGGDIWGTSDQFRLLSQPLAGDGTVSTEVTSQTNTSDWAKAGVMLRQSTDPGSAYYAMEVTPSHGIVIQYRRSAGAAAVSGPSLAGGAPAYLEAARSGNTFTAYTSSDGVTWTPVAGSTVTLDVSGGMLAGLAVTSHNTAAASTAGFGAVSITDSAPPPPVLCPNGWNCDDVGSPGISGDQTVGAGTWTVDGSGSDIWSTSDQFHFVWQSLAGDGAVTGEVTSQTNTDEWAKAGVMLRQSTDPGSAYYAMEITPTHGIVIQYRASAGAAAVSAPSLAGAVPAFLRVSRSGSTFTAYTSSDGVDWTPVAGSTVTLNVSGGMLAGLAVTSHDTGELGIATFTNVSVG